jgi:hypothetical protein
MRKAFRKKVYRALSTKQELNRDNNFTYKIKYRHEGNPLKIVYGEDVVKYSKATNSKSIKIKNTKFYPYHNNFE